MHFNADDENKGYTNEKKTWSEVKRREKPGGEKQTQFPHFLDFKIYERHQRKIRKRFAPRSQDTCPSHPPEADAEGFGADGAMER